MSLIGPDGKPIPSAKALAHPINEYFEFVAPKNADDHVYFRFKMGRYEGTVFHFVFGENFEETGEYRVVLDVVPTKFGEKDILTEDLCQRMIRDFMHDILSHAIQQQADIQTENHVRHTEDSGSDPTQSH